MANQNDKNLQELQNLADTLGKDFASWNLSNLESDAGRVLDLLTSWKKELSLINSGAYDAAVSFQSIVGEMSKGTIGLTKSKSAYSSLTDISQKFLAHQSGISTLSVKEVNTLKDKILFEKQKITVAQENLKERHLELEAQKRASDDLINSGVISTNEKRKQIALSASLDKKMKEVGHTIGINNDTLSSSSEAMAALNNQSDKVADSAKNISKAYGLGGASIQGMGYLLGRIGGPKMKEAMGLEQAEISMRKTALDTTKNGELNRSIIGPFKVFGSGLKSISGALLKSSVVFLAAVAPLKILQSLIKFDQGTGDLAKNLNISYEAAGEVRKEFSEIAKSSGQFYMTTERLSKAAADVSGMYGVQGRLTREQLVTLTGIETTTGLTVEQQKGALALSITNKSNLKDITGEIMAQADISSSRLGVALNEKEVLVEIGKVSAATTLSLSKNPKLIADAVAVSKSLGMELAKVEGIMDSMLDFESSITNELQAELLIGRNINLETARWASLNNDVAGAAKAIANEIGTSAEYSSMNRIQQESLAKAVGMNREELAKTLFTQEQLRNLSGEAAKDKEKELNRLVEAYGIEKAQQALAEGKLDVLSKQMSISDQLGLMMEKIKEIILPLVSKVMPYIAGSMEDIATGLSEGKGLFHLLWQGPSENSINKYKDDFGSEITPNAQETYTSGIQKVNDGIAPSSRGPFTVTDKFGATSVTSDGDHMAVSPNISTRRSSTDSNAISQDNISTQREIQETNKLLKQLLLKQGNVRIDSTQMGTAIGMNTYQIQ